MSALDDLIARDSGAGAGGSALDAVIARDSGGAALPTQAASPTSSSLGEFTSAFGHNLIKPFHGLAQLVENGVAAGANLLPDNPVSRAISRTAAQDNTAQQQWEQQYQQKVPDSAASYSGAVAGQVAPLLFSGVTKGLQTAGDAVANLLPKSLPQILPRVASGVTQGGIVAASSPVDNGDDYFTEKGNQIKTGGIVGGTFPLLGGLAGGVKNVLAPIVAPNTVVKTALQKFGLDPAALSASELVPGSLPTTAQVAGNPSIVAAEKTLFNNPAYKPLLDARNIANNDARLAAVGDVAKTPDAVTAALKARADATKPLQAALLDNGNQVPVAPILDQLDALSKSSLGVRPVIGKAAGDITDQIKRLASVDPATGSLTIGSAHLDAVRQNVKDYLAQHAPNGAVGSQEQAAFEPVRNSIVDSIERANPGYRNYLEKYAKLSQPINTMEAGQSILDNLGNRAPNASGAPQLTLSGFNAQLNKATGGRYGIAPGAEQKLQAVQADLQRAGISNSVRSSGSDTAYNLQAPGWLGQALYGSHFQGGNLVPSLVGAVSGLAAFTHGGGLPGAAAAATGAAYGSKKIADFASKRVNDALAEALLNPEVARGLLTEAKQNPRAFQGLLSRFPQMGLLMSNAASAEQPQFQGLVGAGRQ